MSTRLRCRSCLDLRALAVGALLACGGGPVLAQQMDHSQHMPASTPAARVKGNHAHMGTASILLPLARAFEHEPPSPGAAAADAPREPIPVLTDADRAAAFPDVAGHAAHDNRIHSYWLLDRLEAWDADEGTGIEWEALSWIGTDLDRIWLRTEGERTGGSTESADLEVLYGRNVARWWDAVVGVRQDFGEGPSQTFIAFGVMGLAPYKFEVEATAYIGQSGQTALRLEAEYDTLLTNRLILQWLAEAELHGRNDERRGIGSGLGTVEAGLRLRYEITRQFAPYVGLVWERAFGDTADFRRAEGDDTNDVRLVAGVRIWF